MPFSQQELVHARAARRRRRRRRLGYRRCAAQVASASAASADIALPRSSSAGMLLLGAPSAATQRLVLLQPLRAHLTLLGERARAPLQSAQLHVGVPVVDPIFGVSLARRELLLEQALLATLLILQPA